VTPAEALDLIRNHGASGDVRYHGDVTTFSMGGLALTVELVNAGLASAASCTPAAAGSFWHVRVVCDGDRLVVSVEFRDGYLFVAGIEEEP
jgi:hypothetical protein